MIKRRRITLHRTDVPWYLSGGIAAANCIAAYQPKGAASYAASKISVSTPGSYTLTESTPPDWNAIDGWIFNATKFPLVMPYAINNQNHAVIVRFTGLENINWKYILGHSTTGASFIIGTGGANAMFYQNGSGGQSVTPRIAAGNLAISGDKAYRNGADESITLASWTATNNKPLNIGSYLVIAATVVNIQAIAVYNAAITAPQVAAVYTAMAAL